MSHWGTNQVWLALSSAIAGVVITLVLTVPSIREPLVAASTIVVAVTSVVAPHHLEAVQQATDAGTRYP